MARQCVCSTEPYQIGEVVEFIHGPSLGVIVETEESGRGVAVVIRQGWSSHSHRDLHVGSVQRPVSPQSGFRLPSFDGELTDEEQVLVVKHLLLGVPNND